MRGYGFKDNGVYYCGADYEGSLNYPLGADVAMGKHCDRCGVDLMARQNTVKQEKAAAFRYALALASSYLAPGSKVWYTKTRFYTSNMQYVRYWKFYTIVNGEITPITWLIAAICGSYRYHKGALVTLDSLADSVVYHFACELINAGIFPPNRDPKYNEILQALELA